ncbi:hypothetical protein CLF_111759 [Clonorchis sinensis]|uniref:Uncharacterized protein n=1 Tax=Clonorchis sinensis TaxID=79923 RepID=G7YVB1_CLOSI|nr:hypothetical protein CLF_111759 [Clonorchis sinensis]
MNGTSRLWITMSRGTLEKVVGRTLASKDDNLARPTLTVLHRRETHRCCTDSDWKFRRHHRTRQMRDMGDKFQNRLIKFTARIPITDRQSDDKRLTVIVLKIFSFKLVSLIGFAYYEVPGCIPAVTGWDLSPNLNETGWIATESVSSSACVWRSFFCDLKSDYSLDADLKDKGPNENPFEFGVREHHRFKASAGRKFEVDSCMTQVYRKYRVGTCQHRSVGYLAKQTVALQKAQAPWLYSSQTEAVTYTNSFRCFSHMTSRSEDNVTGLHSAGFQSYLFGFNKILEQEYDQVFFNSGLLQRRFELLVTYGDLGIIDRHSPHKGKPIHAESREECIPTRHLSFIADNPSSNELYSHTDISSRRFIVDPPDQLLRSANFVAESEDLTGQPFDRYEHQSSWVVIEGTWLTNHIAQA